MKFKRKFKVGKNDLCMGNFVVHFEEGYCKVYDLGGCFSVRVLGSTPAGQMLRAMKENAKGGDRNCLNFLKGYGAVMFNVLCSVPDVDFLTALDGAAKSSLERHKDLYGIKDDVTDAEDAEALEEAKELNEALDGAKKDNGIV